MKRFVTVLISVGLLAGVFGCGGDSISPEEKAEQEALDWLVDWSYGKFQAEWDSEGIKSVPIQDAIRKCYFETLRTTAEAFIEEYRPFDYPAYEDTDEPRVGTDRWLENFYQVYKKAIIENGTFRDLGGEAVALFPSIAELSNDGWWFGVRGESPEAWSVRKSERKKLARTCFADLLTVEEFSRLKVLEEL